MSIPNLKPLHSRKIKSISTISNSKTINKKLSYLPPIHSPQGSYKNITDTDLLYEDDIPQQLDSFQKKRRTIHTFFKKNDLKMMNINQIEPMKNINILAKNVSLASFNLSQNLLENSLGEKREQGSFFINELWSHNYYKKIMKFSNLKRTMDDILKLRRNRLNETKKNYLEKQTLEFNKEIHGLDDNLSPFHIKREKGYKNRRAGVSLKYFFLIYF